ncbi:MAG: PKD domain-containing protein, partial [Bacteroidota bacterium]
MRPPKPTLSADGAGGGTGPGNPSGQSPCAYDSMWNNAPLVYPVGITNVTWYVSINGVVDSCTSRVIRNTQVPFSISFTTSPPIVAGVINICNGQTVTVNNNSTGITGQLWNFGNGFYSTNATHTVPAWQYPPGTYYDTLTVYDACGNAHDTAFVVVVDSASGPDIFCISTVCPGDTVTYHTSANCTGYVWSVTGGTIPNPPSPTSDSVTVVWGPGPQGQISLTVTGCTPPLNCPNPTIKTIDIVPATLPIAGDTVVCAGGSSCYEVECIPGNNHSWEILPANAGTVTGQGTCRICVQWAPGFFGPVTIQLNYQNVLTGAGCNLPDQCAEDPGCGGTALLTVNVKPIFGIAGPTKVCPNTTSAPFNGMNLTNNTIAAGVSWKVVTPVPSILNFASTALMNAYTWNAGPGVYQVTAYAPAGVYCNDSATQTVTVVNMLTPNIITGPDTVCTGDTVVYSVAPNMTGVTYTWTVVGGTIFGPANGSSVSIVWNSGGGTVSVVQSLSASPFCSSPPSPVKTVVTWPAFTMPTVTTPPGPICMKSTTTYSIPLPLLSNATYIWSVVPASAGNIISANCGNTITINWISNAITPIFVKLKIIRCYADSVMVPVNLLSLPGVPNISFLPAAPCAGSVVNFSTTNAGPTWNWQFGDAGTSSLQNPVHVYAAGGNYNVQLTVTNAAGCSDTARVIVPVNAVPVVPVITGPSSVCLNTQGGYSFTAPLFTGALYTWSLSNAPKGNIISSTSNSATVNWSLTGTDTVKVRVQSPCIDTTVKYVVVVNPIPVPSITVPSPSCMGSPLTYVGTGGLTYAWSFTGGSPASAAVASPVVTYGLAGTYSTTLAVTDANGCTASTNTSITVNPLPIALISGNSTACDWPINVTLSAVAFGGYTFSWTPGGATTPSISHTINTATAFQCLVTNSFGCTALSNVIVADTVSCDSGCVANDSSDFTWTPPVCLSQTYTKIGPATHAGWNFNLGGSAGPVSPVTANYPFPGVFPVTVTA